MFCRNHEQVLHRPLGKWISPVNDNWQWFISTDHKKLWRYIMNQWEQFNPLDRTVQQPHFSFVSNKCNPPTEYHRTLVKLYTNYIVTEGFRKSKKGKTEEKRKEERHHKWLYFEQYRSPDINILIRDIRRGTIRMVINRSFRQWSGKGTTSCSAQLV